MDFFENFVEYYDELFPIAKSKMQFYENLQNNFTTPIKSILFPYPFSEMTIISNGSTLSIKGLLRFSVSSFTVKENEPPKLSRERSKLYDCKFLPDV